MHSVIFRPQGQQNKQTGGYFPSTTDAEDCVDLLSVLRTEIYTQRYFPSAGTETADGNGVHAVFFCIRSGRKRSMDTIFRF